MKFGSAAVWLACVAGASAAHAQGFTTAAEVKPILQATKSGWVALRDYDGNDLLYFTALESWRCGLNEVRFAMNAPEATQVWEMEPCYYETSQPNAIKMEDRLPYIVVPSGFVQSVVVTITYDDGTSDTAEYERGQILMP